MNLKATLEKFSKLKIIVVGDVMLDVYLWGKVERISPEAPVPVVAIENKEERPGGAANVALNVRELGATPILCSVIGKDESGKSLLQLLKKNKMRSDGIVISSQRITSVKTRVLSKSHQLIRYDSEIISDLNEDDEKKLLAAIKSITKEKPDALIFEDYNKGVITAAAIEKVMMWCKEKNILTAVDPKKKNFFAYKNADVFKPNLREVHEAMNEEISSISKEVLNTIHEELRKNLHHKITMITLSEKGIYFNDGKNSGIVPAHKHNVSDVSGAGDTVIATAVLALAAGMPLKEAVSLANVAGGLVCEQVGVVPVTRKMLEHEIS